MNINARDERRVYVETYSQTMKILPDPRHFTNPVAVKWCNLNIVQQKPAPGFLPHTFLHPPRMSPPPRPDICSSVFNSVGYYLSLLALSITCL
jgi:hypothetical protein